jgi:Na+/proline symporter
MFAGGFAMVFGIVYLRTRQNLAMIEKGMNPKEFANRPAPYKNLKWALLFIGAGIGLFLAYMLDTYLLQHQVTTEVINGNTYHEGNGGNPAIYFP